MVDLKAKEFASFQKFGRTVLGYEKARLYQLVDAAYMQIQVADEKPTIVGRVSK